MTYKFKITNDKLQCADILKGTSGNISTYECVFDISSDYENLTWFAVFMQGNNAYSVQIIGSKCLVPSEVLASSGTVKIGAYASNLSQQNLKRISTNWVYLNLIDGAYKETTTPTTPTPGVWETLALNSVPIIGENGNWYIYDLETKSYVDTEKQSKGLKGDTGAAGPAGATGATGPKGDKGDTGETGATGPQGPKGDKGDKGDTGLQGPKGDNGANGNDGYTPIKGVDYFTEEDIASLNIPTQLSQLSEDSAHRVVTDAEKSTWNGKQDTLVSGTNIKKINNQSLLGSGNIDISGGGSESYELIETIISGYNPLLIQPSDWTTNYSNYYENIGSKISPIYVALTEVKTFEANVYFSYDNTSSQGVIMRSYIPSVVGYKIKKLLIKWTDNKSSANCNGVIFYYFGNDGATGIERTLGELFGSGMYVARMCNTSAPHSHGILSKIENGLFFAADSGENYSYKIVGHQPSSDAITGFRIRGTGSARISVDTPIYVYAVKENMEV